MGFFIKHSMVAVHAPEYDHTGKLYGFIFNEDICDFLVACEIRFTLLASSFTTSEPYQPLYGLINFPSMTDAALFSLRFPEHTVSKGRERVVFRGV